MRWCVLLMDAHQLASPTEHTPSEHLPDWTLQTPIRHAEHCLPPVALRALYTSWEDRPGDDREVLEKIGRHGRPLYEKMRGGGRMGITSGGPK